MRREERVTVQGPVKKQQPDGMSHGGGGLEISNVRTKYGKQRAAPWSPLQGGLGGGRLEKRLQASPPPQPQIKFFGSRAPAFDWGGGGGMWRRHRQEGLGTAEGYGEDGGVGADRQPNA